MIDKREIMETLISLNPRANRREVKIYADYFAEYKEAIKNIEEVGAIVLHPRTGSPVENPYRKIRDNAALMLLKIGIRNTGDLWKVE